MRTAHRAALVALFLGALTANVRRAGTSPIVWLDTFNDDAYVEQCIHEGTCTLTGVATSVPGRVHAVAWLEMRSLLASLGASDDTVHVLMQVLDALALVLTFELATRMGGPLAGVAAAYALGVGLRDGGMRVAALYNTSILVFLGAVLLLACTAAVERANGVAIVLAALVAAVMANVHIGCLLTGVSVVWVALTAPSRRLRLAALGFAVFALATFCIAPPSWLQNFTSVAGRQPQPRAGGAGMPAAIRLTLVGVGGWLLARRVRRADAVAYRRPIQGALAVAVPVAIAFYVWPLFGMEANPKYLVHIEPAAALLAGVPIGIGIAAVAGALLARMHGAFVLRAVEAAAPLALALWLPLAAGPADDPMPTMHDLATVADVLRRQHGWDAADMIERLKAPSSVPILTALRKIAAAPDGSPRGDRDVSTTALLLRTANGDLPDPLPPGWRVIRRAPTTSTLLVVLPSRVDWHGFDVCMQGDDGSDRHCAPSGFAPNDTPVFAVANMPAPGPQARGVLTLRVPVRAGAASETIVMPRLAQTCAGHVVDDGNPAVRVAPDGRRAVVAASGGADPTTVTLAWRLGSAECQAWAYEGLPPFVVTGESDAVARIEPLLRGRERF